MAFSDLSFETQLEAYIWFAGIGICITLAIFFFRRYSKSQIQSRPFFLGLGIFATTYGVARLIENLRKYFISTSLTDIVDAWKSGTQISGLNWDLRIAYYAIAWVGISIFFANVEKYVFQSKTKYLVTITAIIEGTVSICLYNVQAESLPFLIFMGVATAGFFIICISAVALFANMAVKSVGSIRINTAVAAIGVLLFVTGVLADLPETGYVVPLLPDWITGFAAPILIFAGFIIMAVAFARIFSSS